MGNLGAYQLLTTVAYKVGGPGELVAIIAGSGYAILRTAEAGVKRLKPIKSRMKKMSREKADYESEKFEINKSFNDDRGLSLHKGDKIRVLTKIDEEMLLIMKNDDSKPYCISSVDFEHITK